MDSPVSYIVIDSTGQATTYALDIDGAWDYHRIENYLPVMAMPDRAIEDVLHSRLFASGFELVDDSDNETEWGILLDKRHKRLLLYGFGGRWELPDSVVARYALPLLKSRGWRDWELSHAPRGTQDFEAYLLGRDPEWQPYPLPAVWPPQNFRAYLPRNLDSAFQNLLVSIHQRGQWRHFLHVGEDGYFSLHNLLARGPGLIEEFACFTDGALPHETELRCALALDADSRRLAYYIDERYQHQRERTEAELDWIWSGWRRERLPDYGSMLQGFGLAKNGLVLTPAALRVWMQGWLERDPEETWRGNLSEGPKESLSLDEWFEAVLTHAELGPRLVAELELLSQELGPQDPVPCFDPEPGYFPGSYSSISAPMPKSNDFLSRLSESMLMLYDVLYGHPPWLAERLKWPQKSLPSPAELKIHFELGARDPELRWRWLYLLEGQLIECGSYHQNVLRSNWPQGAYRYEWALEMTRQLLQACVRHIRTERELNCLLRILSICPRLGDGLSAEMLPPIGDTPARQASQCLQMKDTLSDHGLSESERAQVLELLPELSPTQLVYWLERSKAWETAEQHELIGRLVAVGGPAVHAQIARRIGSDSVFIKRLVDDWAAACSPTQLRAHLSQSGSADLLLKLMYQRPLEAVWSELLQLIAMEDPVVLRELSQPQLPWTAAFCNELLCHGLGDSPAQQAVSLAAEARPRVVKLWLSLSQAAGQAPLLALSALDSSFATAWPIALAALDEWRSKPELERLIQSLARFELAPARLLEHLLSCSHYYQFESLHLLLAGFACLQREAEAIPALVKWIQAETGPGWSSFEPAYDWLRYKLEAEQRIISRVFRVWPACYEQLQTNASRRWLLYLLRNVRLSEVQKLFWMAYRQDEDTDLKLMAAIALAKQGQAAVRPTLETAGRKLWSLEGLEALHGIGDADWAKRVFDEMRNSRETFVPWHPLREQDDLTIDIHIARERWGYL